MFFILKINILHINNSRKKNTQASSKFPQTSDSLTEDKH